MDVNSKVEKIRKFAFVLSRSLIVLLVVAVILLILAMNEKVTITLVAVFSLILALLFVALCIMESSIIKKLKMILMNNTSLDMAKFTYRPYGGISREYFNISNFIDKYTTYAASDYMQGKLKNGKEFEISEILIRKEYIDEGGHQNKVTLFKGIFGVMPADRNYNFNLRINPDVRNKYVNQVINDLKKMTGATSNVVRLENVEFERYFEVYSDNQVEARKVITIAFMESLLKLRKQIKKKITIIYKSKTIYFFIENGSIINERFLLSKGVCEESIKRITENINNICETVTLL